MEQLEYQCPHCAGTFQVDGHLDGEVACPHCAGGVMLGAEGDSAGEVVEFSCPHCSSPFQVEAAWAGQEVGCPTCGGIVVVPEGLSTTSEAVEAQHVPLRCPLCDGLFEVPAQLAGQEVACPLCHGEVTVPPEGGAPSTPRADGLPTDQPPAATIAGPPQSRTDSPAEQSAAISDQDSYRSAWLPPSRSPAQAKSQPPSRSPEPEVAPQGPRPSLAEPSSKADSPEPTPEASLPVDKTKPLSVAPADLSHLMPPAAETTAAEAEGHSRKLVDTAPQAKAPATKLPVESPDAPTDGPPATSTGASEGSAVDSSDRPARTILPPHLDPHSGLPREPASRAEPGTTSPIGAATGDDATLATFVVRDEAAGDEGKAGQSPATSRVRRQGRSIAGSVIMFVGGLLLLLLTLLILSMVSGLVITFN